VTFSDFPGVGLLADKVIVVTGAGQGMGRVFARVAAREGARVVAADVSGAEAETAEMIGSAAIPFHVDVTCERQIAAMYAAAVDAFGRVDGSVHAHGISGNRRGEAVSFEEYDQLTSVHLGGMLMCSKHAIQTMVPTGGGAVVNFSAVASLNGSEFISAAYAGAKAGVNAMTKSLAVQWGSRGIRVNAVAPGFTLSEKNQNIPADLMAGMKARAALQRAAHAEEPVQLAAFLCSDRAAFISGVVIPVDGGWTARLA
jgi:NAD(P)-dependent dehydrogenase (short-subunit alcohol dehydrogenase family)